MIPLISILILAAGTNLTPSTLTFTASETATGVTKQLHTTGPIYSVRTDQDWLSLTCTPPGIITIRIDPGRINWTPDYFADATITATGPGGLQTATVVLTHTDYFTEQFQTQPDLQFTRLTFIPDASSNYYCPASEPISQLDPITEEAIALTFSNTQAIPLQPRNPVTFFGRTYHTLYITPFGQILFNESDPSAPVQNLLDHLARPAITALSTADATQGGFLTITENHKTLTIYYQDIPPSQSSQPSHSSHFQIQFHQNGQISLTYLQLLPQPAIIGISAGYPALPPDYADSDLSAYGTDCLPHHE